MVHTKQRVRKRSKLHRSVVLLLFISIGIVVVSVTLLIYIYNQTITKIHIEGNIEFSPETVQKIIKLPLPQKYIDIDRNAIERVLETHPLIYTASIKKTFSSILVITLTRANPVVSILSTVGNREHPSYFDKDGVCIQVGAQNGIVDVPILSGVSVQNPKPGVRLPRSIVSFIRQIDIIRQENPFLFSKVSEFFIKYEDNLMLVDIYFSDYAQYITSELYFYEETLSKMYYFLSKIEHIDKTQHFSSFEIIGGSIIGRLANGS